MYEILLLSKLFPNYQNDFVCKLDCTCMTKKVVINIALSIYKCILIVSITVSESQSLCSYTHLNQTQSRIKKNK